MAQVSHAQIITTQENEINSEEIDNYQGMEGMADVINKILGKSTAKNVVLSKNKHLLRKKGLNEDQVPSKKSKTDQSKENENNRVLPGIKNDAVKETMLKRIGTRGVVVLFNTVSNHQKALCEKKSMARTEREKEKATKSLKKSCFMEMLKTGHNDKMRMESMEAETNSSWSVFQENFMLGTSLKHWDRDEPSAQNTNEQLSSGDEEE